MKFNLEKLQQLATPLPDKEREQMETQIENRNWLLLSVRLAIKIRNLMAAEGISQSELARRMRVSPAQVTKILSGQENLGLKTIAKVEAALGNAIIDVTDDDCPNAEPKENTPTHIFIESEPIKGKVSTSPTHFKIASHIAYS